MVIGPQARGGRSRVGGHRLEVLGWRKNPVANPVQILTIDKGRLIRKIGQIEKEKIVEVDEAIKISLGVT